MVCNISYNKETSKSKCFKTAIDNSVQHDNVSNNKPSEVSVKTLSIDSIKIGKRFRCDLGDVSSLVKSIEKVGLLQPVVVSEDYELIAGQRRLEACKQLGWTEIPIHLVNINEIVKGEFHENVVRKNFTYSEMVAIKRYIEPAEREEAKARMLKGQPCADSAQGSNSGKTRDKVAEYTDISHDTLSKAEKIVKAAEDKPEKFEEIRQKMDTNEYSVDRAFSIVREQKKLEELESIIDPQSGQEILEKLGISIRPFDVWNFPKLDERFGKKYPGQIPADIVFNTLYFFTKQHDLVVDPMAGGGVVGDVCKIMKRECRMYDIHPVRDDIIRHDITKGIPAEMENAELLFWDPPYYKKKEKDYGSNSVSALSREEYLKVFENAAKAIHGRGIQKIAFLMSDYGAEYGGNNGDGSICICDYISIFEKYGQWKLLRHISCPLTTQQIRDHTIEKFKEDRKLARLSRWLLLLERIDMNNSSGHVQQQQQHQHKEEQEDLIVQKPGTKGVAAPNLDRKFLGIEKDVETFEIARAKIRNKSAAAQGRRGGT
jgi:ParB-like chromosome segregation protein Spo0J